MPLLDHFRKPVETRAPWASVGTIWTGILAMYLNRLLPNNRYFALAKVYQGSQTEADISEYEVQGEAAPSEQSLGLLPVPEAVVTVNTRLPIFDEYSIQIHDERDDMKLVAAIEFVSPANKDLEEARIQFTQKCVGYLRLGIGLVLVDVVTTRGANLHNDLLEEMDAADVGLLADCSLYTVGYQPRVDGEHCQLKMWPYPAQVGGSLRSVPLALKNGPMVMLPLEETYESTISGHSLPRS